MSDSLAGREQKSGQPPFRHVPFAKLDLDVEHLKDGAIIMHSRTPLTLRELHLPAYLTRHANARPDRAWLAQRKIESGDWRELSFSDAKRQVDGMAQAILDMQIPVGRSLLIPSGNSIEHAVMMLAGMQAGVPIAPVSEAYSLMSGDFGRLKQVCETAAPGLIFVQDGAKFGPALAGSGLDHLPIIAAENVQAGHLAFTDLAATEPGDRLVEAMAAIKAESTAKIMFTSGSTGTPKGVPLTHEGLLVAAESNLTTMGRLDEGVGVRLDWAPWSHVFGATTLSLSIIDGGTFYIDEGKPVPGLFSRTVRNLAEVQPDFFMNVPSAIAMLIDEMEADEALAGMILEKMTALGYGGAALPADIVARFEALAIRHTGQRITIVCGYGTTETGPGGGFVYWPTDVTGTLGLPHPGFAMKLVPLGDQRYDVRVSSKAVTKGYINRPDLNQTIFDEQGFYQTGDCVRFSKEGDPQSGLIFAGRLNEEFKLLNGTFVRVGEVRIALLDALAPLVKEVVVCGENQSELRVLAWLNAEASAALDDVASTDIDALNDSAAIQSEISAKMAEYNRKNPSASNAVRAMRLLALPPQLDHGELTDKGSVNQRAVKERRANDVDGLFSTNSKNVDLHF
ncbi:MAG: AMP-binding protein [Sphingorhabdus sp.]